MSVPFLTVWSVMPLVTVSSPGKPDKIYVLASTRAVLVEAAREAFGLAEQDYEVSQIKEFSLSLCTCWTNHNAPFISGL